MCNNTTYYVEIDTGNVRVADCREAVQELAEKNVDTLGSDQLEEHVAHLYQVLLSILSTKTKPLSTNRGHIELSPEEENKLCMQAYVLIGLIRSDGSDAKKINTFLTGKK